MVQIVKWKDVFIKAFYSMYAISVELVGLKRFENSFCQIC